MTKCASSFPDRLELLPDGALIQHGPYSDRIYLMKTPEPMPEEFPESLVRRAREAGYSKIFAKVPAPLAPRFLAADYRCEARIPGFFNRKTDGVFLGRFLTGRRAAESSPAELDRILALARSGASAPAPPPESGFKLRAVREADADELAGIYRIVFPSYPFPIHDPDYLRQTMRENIRYFCMETDGRIAAVSSAELDPEAAAAEMTDFATLPEWRGHRLAARLLGAMERDIARSGIRTVYTIARAASAGMNLTFARGGYEFAGRLVNNTNISGGIESMNVWFKAVGAAESDPRS